MSVLIVNLNKIWECMIRLAIDLDGTLADSFAMYRQIAAEEGVTEDFSSAYNGIFKVRTSKGEIFGNVLFGKYREKLIVDVQPMKGAVKAYKKILDNDQIIPYFVTARYEDVYRDTEKWLYQHGFTGYEDLIFEKEKLNTPCNAIVDDKPKTVREFADNARLAYIMDAPYNKDCKGRRVHNLTEVYNDLLKFI